MEQESKDAGKVACRHHHFQLWSELNWTDRLGSPSGNAVWDTRNIFQSISCYLLHSFPVALDKTHHWAPLEMEILRQSKMVRRVRSRPLCHFCPRNSSFTPHPFCLPSSLVKCKRLMFPVWLQPQPALISCSPSFHWPGLYPNLSRSSVSPCSDLLTALQFPERSLLSSCWWHSLLSFFTFLESYPFPMQSCLWPLGNFYSSSPVVPHSLPTCVTGRQNHYGGRT